MDTSLLAIGYVGEAEGFGPTAGSPSEHRGPTFAMLLETNLAPDQPQSPPNKPDKSNAPGTPPQKTDNIPAQEVSEHANLPPANLPRVAVRAATNAAPTKTGRSEEPQKQQAPSDIPNPVEIVKLWLSQYSQNVERGKEGLAAKMQPRAGYELAQMFADSHGRQVGPAAPNAVKSPGLVPLLAAKGKTHSRTVLLGPLAKLNQTLGKSNQGKNGQIISISAKPSIAAAAGANLQGAPKTTSDSPPGLKNPQTLTDERRVLTRSAIHPRVQETLLAGRNPDSTAAPGPAVDKASLQKQLHSLPLAGNRDAHAQTGNDSPNQADPLRAQSKAVLAVQQNSALPPQQPPKAYPAAAQSPKRSKAAEQKQTRENALEGATSKKLNPEGLQLQVRPGQTKSRNTASKDGSHPHLERMLLQNNAHGEPAKSSSGVSAHAAKTAGSPMQQADSPGRQVLEYIRSSLRPGDQQITIRLNPPELGRVLIKFEEQQQQITGFLEVSRIQTRYEIEHALPQIIRTLHDAGVQVKRLEVVLADQTEQQNFKDQSQSLHDGFSQEHNSPQRAETYDDSADQWLNNDSASADAYQPQLFVTENSINVLL